MSKIQMPVSTLVSNSGRSQAKFISVQVQKSLRASTQKSERVQIEARSELGGKPIKNCDQISRLTNELLSSRTPGETANHNYQKMMKDPKVRTPATQEPQKQQTRQARQNFVGTIASGAAQLSSQQRTANVASSGEPNRNHVASVRGASQSNEKEVLLFADGGSSPNHLPISAINDKHGSSRKFHMSERTSAVGPQGAAKFSAKDSSSLKRNVSMMQQYASGSQPTSALGGQPLNTIRGPRDVAASQSGGAEPGTAQHPVFKGFQSEAHAHSVEQRNRSQVLQQMTADGAKVSKLEFSSSGGGGPKQGVSKQHLLRQMTNTVQQNAPQQAASRGSGSNRHLLKTQSTHGPETHKSIKEQLNFLTSAQAAAGTSADDQQLYSNERQQPRGGDLPTNSSNRLIEGAPVKQNVHNKHYAKTEQNSVFASTAQRQEELEDAIQRNKDNQAAAQSRPQPQSTPKQGRILDSSTEDRDRNLASSGLTMLQMHEQALLQGRQNVKPRHDEPIGIGTLTANHSKEGGGPKISSRPERVSSQKEYGMSAAPQSTQGHLNHSKGQGLESRKVPVFQKMGSMTNQMQNLTLNESSSVRDQTRAGEGVKNINQHAQQAYKLKQVSSQNQASTQNLLPETIFGSKHQPASSEHQNKANSSHPGQTNIIARNAWVGGGRDSGVHQSAARQAERAKERVSSAFGSTQQSRAEPHQTRKLNTTSVETSIRGYQMPQQINMNNERSPYQHMPQSVSAQKGIEKGSTNSLMGQGPGRRVEIMKTQQRVASSSTRQNLNNSQSIENERNRIYDVVNSSSFGLANMAGIKQNGAVNANRASQNALFGLNESTASPAFRSGPAANTQDNSGGVFNSQKNGTARTQKPTTQKNLLPAGGAQNARNDDHSLVSNPNVALNMASQQQQHPLEASKAQASSQKGIPQISQGTTYSTTEQKSTLLPKSLYQTHQGGKYNFITPMILSDLHHLSSIQQTTQTPLQTDSQEGPDLGLVSLNQTAAEPTQSNNTYVQGTNKGSVQGLKSYRKPSKQTKRRFEGATAAGHTSQSQPEANSRTSLTNAQAQIQAQKLRSRQEAGQAVTTQSNLRDREDAGPGQGEDRSGSHFVSQHPPSESSIEGLTSQQVSLQQNVSVSRSRPAQQQISGECNFTKNQQNVPPAFVQKRRRLKTPASYLAREQNDQDQPEDEATYKTPAQALKRKTLPPNSQNNQIQRAQESTVRPTVHQQVAFAGMQTKNVFQTNDGRVFVQPQKREGAISPKNGSPQEAASLTEGDKDGFVVGHLRSMSHASGTQASLLGAKQLQVESVSSSQPLQSKQTEEAQAMTMNDNQVSQKDLQYNDDGGESKFASPSRPRKGARGLKSRNGKHGRTSNLKRNRKQHLAAEAQAERATHVTGGVDETGTTQDYHRVTHVTDEGIPDQRGQTKRQKLNQLSDRTQPIADGEETMEQALDQQYEVAVDDNDWSMASILSSGPLQDESQGATTASQPTQKAPESSSSPQSEAVETGVVDLDQVELPGLEEVQPKKAEKEIEDPEDAKDAQGQDQGLSEKAQSKGKEEEKKGAYFDEHKLAQFNKMAQKSNRQSEDPLIFAQQKVAGFLVKNPLNQRFVQKEKGRLPYSVFKPHATQVTFLKSIFEGRPPVAFFQYPSYVGVKRVADRIRMYSREEVEHLFMSFRISDSTHIYNAVVNSCKAAGFTMLESNTNIFNVQWTGYIGANDIKHLNKYQKTNHFPGSSQLGRKDLLWRNMNRMRSKFPKDFVISPMSYLVNEEHDAFQAERQRDSSALWILKPAAASCGRGIKIVNSQQRVNKREGYLACKYIANPHLLNGLKYDLRVYVLVTSFNPLRVYMYNDGLVRFATEKYSNDPRKLQKKYVHLTNFSINKKNDKFVKNSDNARSATQTRPAGQAQPLEDEDQQEFDQNSSKWDFKMLRQAYEKQGINYEYVIAQFKDLIVKTLLCVESHVTQNLQKNPTSRNNCFELYGFDILVDSNFKPWVLEVNVLPSLSSSSPFDKRIKTMLICDSLTLVGIRGYDKQKFHSQTTELLGLAPFAQSMTLSELRQKPRLHGTEQLTKDELEMLMDLDEEFMRRGNFQRIFPLASNASFYEQFFETRRYQNALCASYLTSPQHIRDQLLHKYRRVYNSQV